MKRTGILLVLVLAVSLVGTADASHHRKPGYTAKGHRHDSALSSWSLSYTGSASWSVTYEGSNSEGSFKDQESGNTEWHYHPSNDGGVGFSVAFPTPCRRYHSLPCPEGLGVGTGKGPVAMSISIDDHTTSGSPPMTNTLSCMHDATVHSGGGAELTAKYIRATDSYALSVSNTPIPGQLVADDETGCPDANGVTKLDDWVPTDLPPGSSYHGGHWWAVKQVVIPANVFAGSNAIDIPISLIDRFGPPGDCGLPAAPAGETRSCKVRGSWRGMLTLHRTS